MRESTIEQKDNIFVVHLYEKILVKVVTASSKNEAEFISRCWDSGIFSKDEFDYV